MPESGILLVDKPVGPTSHDVVARLRQITGIQKIGHGGTLDPLASGLLVVGIGQATKQLAQFSNGDKSYECTVCLGITSTTDDAEGELAPQPVTRRPTRAMVEQAAVRLTGPQQQVPPVYSAIKTDGRVAYREARAGRPVARQARAVTIYRLHLTRYRWPYATFTADVSTGTYIRAIGRDLGELLGTGGYVSQLRRTRVGDRRVSDAVPLAELAGRWRELLIA